MLNSKCLHVLKPPGTEVFILKSSTSRFLQRPFKLSLHRYMWSHFDVNKFFTENINAFTPSSELWWVTLASQNPFLILLLYPIYFFKETAGLVNGQRGAYLSLT